ncbi:MAG: hypothetical protein E7660_03895 [Ruminococcaceae bacterium]|nr:hypothetical protein [Oscillospiraceae bacterium]
MSILLNIASDFIDVSSVNEISESCGVTKEYAYAELVAAVCGVDSAEKDRTFFKNYFLPMIHECDKSIFENDPYYKNIKIPELTKGNWKFTNMKLKPCEAFVCNDFLVPDDGRLIPQIGFFTEEFPYPAVLENGREWMTLMPNETVTTLPAVKKAHGKVVTFGLGLGYFTYMASLKEEVESVTVVELSSDVISLFEEHILPQFENRDKVKIICADAFDFAENTMKPGDFDFVFADFWHDVGDGRELYLKMKEYEKNFPETEFTYWLEDTIKCYLDRDLWP